MFINPTETLTGELLSASVSIVQIRLLKLIKNRGGQPAVYEPTVENLGFTYKANGKRQIQVENFLK